MATTYHQRSSYNNQRSTTHTITFYDHQIDTLVTKHPDIVSSWIYQTEKIHQRHIKSLIVGLDTESRIYDKQSKVAIVQICIGTRCLIFQIIHSSKIPSSLIKFMNNPNYTFTGVDVYDDIVKLQKDYGLGFEAKVMDLRDLSVKVYGSGSNKFGLKRLTDLVLDHKVIPKPKKITLSWWDKYKLSYEQVEYACLDAFVSFEIARVLLAKVKNNIVETIGLRESMFQIYD